MRKPEAIKRFRQEIWRHYKNNRRSFSWRDTRDPYRILVSEVMLQQTQTSRVLPKYDLFIRKYPDFRSLARAPLPGILKAWQGLGYNRRAVALKKLAAVVMDQYKGRLPDEPELLALLPGIGKATAGAIAAFAFDKPVIFIETNIRRAHIHFFFPKAKSVPDGKLLLLIGRTLSRRKPREWYYALMDYGAMLGVSPGAENANRRSAAYKKQSPFKGSRRAMRGDILRILLRRNSVSAPDISKALGVDLRKGRELAEELVREGFLRRVSVMTSSSDRYSISK